MVSIKRSSDKVIDNRNEYEEKEKDNVKNILPFFPFGIPESHKNKAQNTFDLPKPSKVISDSHAVSRTRTENLTDKLEYFTANIDEGYASIEIVAELDSKSDINKQAEDEIFTATPIFLSYNTNDEQRLTDFLPSKDFDSSSSVSESDEEIIFNLLSDDDRDLLLTNPVFQISEYQDEGNLPNFDQLDVAVTVGIKLETPPNPLVSKRVPTATETPLLEPDLPETSETFQTEKELTTETSKIEQGKISFQKSDTTTVLLNEKVALTYCSTNVQSALLGKLATVTDDSTVTSFSVPKRPQISIKDTESPNKLKSHKRMKTDKANFGFEKDVESADSSFESEVGKAFKESVTKGSVLPLLKQELQCKIQVRRLKRGEPELVIEPEGPKKYELTEEEIKKKQSRLEQNRKSADKSRQKVKERVEKLKETIKTEMMKNARLRGEAAGLTKLRDKFMSTLDDHIKVCKKFLE